MLKTVLLEFTVLEFVQITQWARLAFFGFVNSVVPQLVSPSFGAIKFVRVGRGRLHRVGAAGRGGFVWSVGLFVQPGVV